MQEIYKNIKEIIYFKKDNKFYLISSHENNKNNKL